MGDFLARGVGIKLERQSHMFSKYSKSGAKIEEMTEHVKKLEGKEDRHLVFVVGTNNIEVDGSEIVLSKYQKLIEEAKKVKNRKISVVGILKRTDVGVYVESKRIGVTEENV